MSGSTDTVATRDESFAWTGCLARFARARAVAFGGERQSKVRAKHP
jgi:hypothetical protein